MNERAWMFLILCKLSYTDISSGIFFLCLVAEGESLHLNISLGGGGGCVLGMEEGQGSK